jgi:hypothetical protein
LDSGCGYVLWLHEFIAWPTFAMAHDLNSLHSSSVVCLRLPEIYCAHIQGRVITSQLKYCEMNWTSWGAQLPSTSSLRLDTAMLGSEWKTSCICTFRLCCFSIVMNSTIWTKIQQNP